jgi:hypothetical protein
MNATTYNTATPRTEKFMNLVGDLQTDIKNLIKKEIELAKAEMGEKFSVMGRNAAFAAAGGITGLMAVFMLLLGLGAIIARLLVKADLSPGAAYFISYMGLAVVLGAVAYALIHKAMAAFSKLSLAPEKALASVQAAEPVPIEIKRKAAEVKTAPKPSSDQLQDEVIATRTRMDNELSELKARLTPAYMRKCFVGGVKNHPLPAIIVSLASTGLGGYLIYRKQQKLALVRRQASGLRRWWNLNVRHA